MHVCCTRQALPIFSFNEMLFLVTVYCQQRDFTYLCLQRDKGVSLAAYVYLTQLKPFREVSR